MTKYRSNFGTNEWHAFLAQFRNLEHVIVVDDGHLQQARVKMRGQEELEMLDLVQVGNYVPIAPGRVRFGSGLVARCQYKRLEYST